MKYKLLLKHTIALPRAPLWRLICLMLFVQVILADVAVGQESRRKVSGKVVSQEDGNSLPGVTIVEIGTTNGTITNADGMYTLDVSPDATLAFSFVGYIKQEVSVSNRSVVDVELALDVTQLEEMVVVGFGTVRKRDLTGSVASIKTDDLDNIPVTNIGTALQGRAPGVNVRQSETSPGGDISIRVRGVSTFMGKIEPLYVIDGVIGGNINTINPTDIESIEILKDASSTAIYGTAGANGVVLVTTKSGEAGRPTITLDARYGVQAITRKLDVLSTREWAEMDNYRSQLLGFTHRWDVDNMTIDTDFQDLLYRVAPIQNYNLSSTGGSEKLNYFVSGNYIDQEGIVKNTDFSRFNIRLNLDSKISDRVKVGTRIGVSRSLRHSMSEEGVQGRGPVLSSAILLPNLDPYDQYGQLVPYFTVQHSSGRQEQIQNPIHAQTNLINDAKATGISGSLFAEIELLKGLNFRPNFSYNLNSGKSGSYKSSRVWDGASGFQNAATIDYYDNYNWNTDLVLNYQTSFGAHNLGLLGGMVITKAQDESAGMEARDFAIDNFSYHSIGNGQTIQGLRSSWAEKKGLGYISRLNYNLQEKYYFTFSSRYDGSSVMGKDNKWGFFPSAAIMWRLSEEQFIKDLDLFDEAKIRASYGVSGSDALGPYASHAKMQGSLSNGYNFERVPTVGYILTSLPVPDLRWEETAQLDVGFETSFLNGRLEFMFDYYHKTTNNLFLSVPVPRTSGVSSVVKNTGSLENKGYEFMVSGRPISNANFQYTTSFNIAFQKQQVTDIGDVNEIILGVPKMGPAQNVFQVKVGQPLGAFYGLRQNGIWQLDESYALQFGTLAQAGDIKFVDQNNDGDVNADDRVVIGNALPKFFGGWNNTFSYKGFDASLFFDFVYGNDIYNVSAFRLNSSSTLDANKVKAFLDYWTPENPDATYPSPASSTSDGGGYLPEWFLQDGSFFRLREVSLGYSLPSNKMRMRVFAAATNVLTFTDYEGGNPEVDEAVGSPSIFNIEYGGYPYYRTFTVGTTITF